MVRLNKITTADIINVLSVHHLQATKFIAKMLK